jgi:hypothetical protein
MILLDEEVSCVFNHTIWYLTKTILSKIDADF